IRPELVTIGRPPHPIGATHKDLIMRIASLSFLAFTLLASGCTDDDEPTEEPSSIVEIAQATPSLSTLVAAVQFASDGGDLVQLLASPGTLTVFAPTNAAFDALAVELTGSAT